MRNLILSFLIASSLTGCTAGRSATEPPYITGFNQFHRILREQPKDTSFRGILLDTFQDEHGHFLANYRVEAQGLPPNIRLRLHSFYGRDAEALNRQVATDSDGNLRMLSKNGTASSEPVHIVVDASPGMRTYLFLTYSHDVDRFYLTCPITPSPITASSSDGAEIQISRIEGEWNLMFLELKRFRPREKITLTSISGHEVMDIKHTMDDQGNCSTILSPAVIGLKSAHAYIQLLRHGKLMRLDYDWSERSWKAQDRRDYIKALQSLNLR